MAGETQEEGWGGVSSLAKPSWDLKKLTQRKHKTQHKGETEAHSPIQAAYPSITDLMPPSHPYLDL